MVCSLTSSRVLRTIDLSSILVRAFGFNRVTTMINLYTYSYALANQVIHPFGFGKLVPAILWCFTQCYGR